MLSGINIKAINFIVTFLFVSLIATVSFLYGLQVKRCTKETDVPRSASTDATEHREIQTIPILSSHIKLTARIKKITDFQADLELVEFASGDRADQLSIEEGACTFDQAMQHECTPNGFFIRSTGKIITIPIDPNTEIRVYDRDPVEHFMRSDESGSIYLKSISPSALSEALKNNSISEIIPFDIELVEGRLVLTERYIP